ncbi:MAG: hypothetical protein CML42_08340 [Rhodobacteraceae bacterium]|nr:hypothetical protein [Paracoccaceae bacterium]|tara:strand:+ start:39802 stop:40140 length:339 start_codon:yes stop_codon:yes gene_type:complete
MEDNTKKIMLVSTILGTLAAATFGYKYYYEESPQRENNSTNTMKKQETQKIKLPKGERTKERTSFLSSFTQTIGFGNRSSKNPDENTTKKEVTLELQEKKLKTDDKTWPTFN